MHYDVSGPLITIVTTLAQLVATVLAHALLMWNQ